MTDVVAIAPEQLEIANMYLTLGTIKAVASAINVPADKVSEVINTPEVKRYIDNVYLDQGYRNRVQLGSLLDEIIASKLEEARETELYSTKDLADLIALAHKMRMDELKRIHEEKRITVRTQNNIQVNSIEQDNSGNIGKLVKAIIEQEEC